MRCEAWRSWVLLLSTVGWWGCSIYDRSLLGSTPGVGVDGAEMLEDSAPGAGGSAESGSGGAGGDPAALVDAASDVDPADVPDEPLPMSCTDGVQNESETDVDCGGTECPPCATGKGCVGWHDCVGGLCESKVCTIGRTCNEIHTSSTITVDGAYQVDVDGSGPLTAFAVYCDMTTAGGGWTRVGFEPSGSGGNSISGRLSYLGIEVPTANAVARASGAALIGPRFNGLYKELWINWGSTYARMTVGRDIFVNTVDTAIPTTNFTTNDAKLTSWMSAAGGATFCRAAKSVDQRPGDTSWAIKPVGDVDFVCGCSGMGWTGRGGFYGGVVPATACANWGGAWAGPKDTGEKKGGLVSSADLTLWVR